MTAGQDATEAFYGLHRHDVITKPQYARLQVGVIGGAKSVIHSNVVGELSEVPYAEPTWLTKGYYSPYYNEASFLDGSVQCRPDKFQWQSHKRFQKFMRKFTDEIVVPDAVVRLSVFCYSTLSLRTPLQAREEDGKPPSASVVEAMAYVLDSHSQRRESLTHNV
jgi:hypothetical protein